MKKALLVIMVSLVCGVFLASCGAPKFVNKSPAFSFEYPSGYKAEPLQGKTEVARIANQNQYKIPVYTATVSDKAAGAKLEDMAQGWVDTVQQNTPKADRFKVLEQNLVKLSDGTDAVAFKIKWRWIDRVTYLQSSAVSAFQGDKVINITGTTVFGGDTSMDKMLEQCMTLKFSE